MFVDDASQAATTLLGPGAPFSMLSLKLLPSTIGVAGFDVRLLLLSDLLRPTLDLSRVRLAVFANAYVVSDTTAQTIQSRLACDNRTLAWVYAPALLSAADPATANMTRVQEMTGLPLRLGSGYGQLQTVLANAAPSVTASRREGGTGGGRGEAAPVWSADVNGTLFGESAEPVAPWLYVDSSGSDGSRTGGGGQSSAAAVTPLGSYTTAPSAARVSVAWADQGSHKALFMGSPGLPSAAWRDVATAAGVHVYLPDPSTVGDTVQVRGDLLLVHAGAVAQAAARGDDGGRTRAANGASGGDGTAPASPEVVPAAPLTAAAGAAATAVARHVVLPSPASSVVDAETGRVVCATACTAFDTGAMVPGDVALFRIVLSDDG